MSEFAMPERSRDQKSQTSMDGPNPKRSLKNQLNQPSFAGLREVDQSQIPLTRSKASREGTIIPRTR